MADNQDPQLTNVDPKLEMTDAKGLSDLDAAFDEAFGPSDRKVTPAKEQKAQPREKPQARQQRVDESKAAPGHHAPVEVESVEVTRRPEKEVERQEPVSFNLLDDPDEPKPEPKAKAAPPVVKPEKEAKPETKPEVAKETSEEPEGEGLPAEEEPDPEIDGIRAKPNAHPHVKEGIQKLKEVATARRKEIQALKVAQQKLSTELETIRTKGIPAEIQKELTTLRGISQRFDMLNDEGFKTKYETPISQRGERLLEFMVSIASDKETMKNWAEQTRKFGFTNIGSEYWDKEIIPNIHSPINQARAAALAAQLTESVDERNRVVNEFVANPDKIAEYRQQQQLEHWTNFQREAQEEADRLVANIGDWAQVKDLEKAKSPEERQTFEAHNSRTNGYKTLFEKTMGDLIGNSPKKMVRVAAQAVYGIEIDRQLKETVKKLNDMTAQYNALRTQHEKVTRVRSVPGRPTTGGAKEAAPEETKGIHAGDAKQALKNFFSGVDQGTNR